jgi:hypothetical protein
LDLEANIIDSNNRINYDIGQHLEDFSMSVQPRYLTRTIRFHPAEADRLADRIRDSISRTAQENGLICAAAGELDFNWEGNRKDDFFSKLDPQKRAILDRIEHLRQTESYFRSITVTRQETYLNPAYGSS